MLIDRDVMQVYFTCRCVIVMKKVPLCKPVTIPTMVEPTQSGGAAGPSTAISNTILSVNPANDSMNVDNGEDESSAVTRG